MGWHARGRHDPIAERDPQATEATTPLAGVVIFLVWLWLSNLAILLGLEFDAELARQRAISGGMPAEEEPYVEPRDTRTWPRRRDSRPDPAP